MSTKREFKNQEYGFAGWLERWIERHPHYALELHSMSVILRFLM